MAVILDVLATGVTVKENATPVNLVAYDAEKRQVSLEYKGLEMKIGVSEGTDEEVQTFVAKKDVVISTTGELSIQPKKAKDPGAASPTRSGCARRPNIAQF